MVSYIVNIKAQIDAGDITGAIISVITIALPVFAIFVVLDLLTTKIFGAGFDLSGIKQFLAQFFKVDLFMSAIVGAWVGAGLKSPAEQIANKMFRPAIMNTSIATFAYNSGRLTEAQWRDKMGRWGVPEGEMAMIADIESMKPEITNIARYITLVDVSDSDIEYILNQSAVTNPNIRAFYKKYIRAVQLRDEYSQYITVLKSAYLNGFITSTFLEQEILTHKGSTVESKQVIENMTNSFGWSLTASEVATRTWLYRKGVYTPLGALQSPPISPEDYFYNELLALNIQTPMCNAIVRLEAAKNGIDYERP